MDAALSVRSNERWASKLREDGPRSVRANVRWPGELDQRCQPACVPACVPEPGPSRDPLYPDPGSADFSLRGEVVWGISVPRAPGRVYARAQEVDSASRLGVS